MPVYKPPGYRNSQSTSVAQEDTLSSVRSRCERVSVPWSRGEAPGAAACRSCAADRERMLHRRCGPKEDIPCSRLLEIWRGPWLLPDGVWDFRALLWDVLGFDAADIEK